MKKEQELRPRKERKEHERLDYMLSELVKVFIKESIRVKSEMKAQGIAEDLIATFIANNVFKHFNAKWQQICHRKWKHNKPFPAAFTESVKANLKTVPVKPEFNINTLLPKE